MVIKRGTKLCFKHCSYVVIILVNTDLNKSAIPTYSSKNLVFLCSVCFFVCSFLNSISFIKLSN